MISLNGTPTAGPFLWVMLAIMAIFLVFFLRDMLRRLRSVIQKTDVNDWIKNGSPFVGYDGFNTGLSIQPQGTSIIVRTGIATNLWLITGLFLFGPGMPLILWAQRDKIHKDLPVQVYIILGIFVVMATCLFISNLTTFIWHRPYAEITSDSVNCYRGRKEEAHISLNNVRDVEISTSSVSSGSMNTPPTTNYSLEILTQDEAVYVLCISDSQDRIESLKTAIDQRRKVFT